MSAKSKASNVSRRKFLKGGAVATGAAAATVAFPQVSRAETTTLKMQSSWGAKSIFQDMAKQYAVRVEAMSGGRLKVDLLPSGAVVKAFQVQDAVNKGVLDGAHSVSVYWYGKSKVASLFGTGPVFGQNGNRTEKSRCIGAWSVAFKITEDDLRSSRFRERPSVDVRQARTGQGAVHQTRCEVRFLFDAVDHIPTGVDQEEVVVASLRNKGTGERMEGSMRLRIARSIFYGGQLSPLVSGERVGIYVGRL